MGADGFGGVEAAVDPDDGFAFGGEGAGFGFGEIFGAGEAPGDVLVAGEFGEVSRGRDDHHVLGAILLGFADVDEAQAIGLGGEFLEVGFGLFVGGEVVVIPDGEAVVILGAREFLGGQRDGHEGKSGEQGEQAHGILGGSATSRLTDRVRVTDGWEWCQRGIGFWRVDFGFFLGSVGF